MENPFPVPCSWAVHLRTLPLAISAKLKCCHPHEETSLPARLQELAVMTWPATLKLLEDAGSAPSSRALEPPFGACWRCS